MPNAIDIRVDLHDLLVVTSAELRAEYPNDPAIIICDALKCKSGIARLTLRAIVVPGGTGLRPLDVYNVHRTAAAGQTNIVVILAHPAQLRYVAR
jgi:hypothetical protein